LCVATTLGPRLDAWKKNLMPAPARMLAIALPCTAQRGGVV
jgi:hypothetical protein